MISADITCTVGEDRAVSRDNSTVRIRSQPIRTGTCISPRCSTAAFRNSGPGPVSIRRSWSVRNCGIRRVRKIQHVMKKTVCVSFCALVIFALSTVVQAQPYRAPRMADGKPNLNGVWQALNEAYWDIEGHAAAP